MKMKAMTEKRFFEWHEDDVSVTLRNRGGSYGHGSEVLVICYTNGCDKNQDELITEVIDECDRSRCV